MQTLITDRDIMQLADAYAKAYFMGRGEEARKLLQAAIINAEVAAHAVTADVLQHTYKCKACGTYCTPLSGESKNRIICDSDGNVPPTSDQLREEYASGLDSPTGALNED